MNTRFDAMEESIVQYGSRLSNIETNVSQLYGIKNNLLGICNLILVSLLIHLGFTTLKDNKEPKTPHKEGTILIMMIECSFYSSSYIFNVCLR